MWSGRGTRSDGARLRKHQHGIAAVALHNSHHIGCIGYRAEQRAAAGFVSIHFVSVVGSLQWSRRSTVATAALAPIRSVVFPRKDNFPAVARLRHQRHCIWQNPRRLGIKASPCRRCLIDVNGVPTTNPAVQESPLGSLLTFAEHKGYAPCSDV
ncbi:hypothetical protein DMI62_19390 [Escherichia coli]|nr:hypothetical protein [Escherichia coli]